MLESRPEAFDKSFEAMNAGQGTRNQSTGRVVIKKETKKFRPTDRGIRIWRSKSLKRRNAVCAGRGAQQDFYSLA
jgi:hypothetical protein